MSWTINWNGVELSRADFGAEDDLRDWIAFTIAFSLNAHCSDKAAALELLRYEADKIVAKVTKLAGPCELNLAQATELVKCFGGDKESVVVVQRCKSGHSGPGVYAHLEDYPDEGSHFLGALDVD